MYFFSFTNAGNHRRQKVERRSIAFASANTAFCSFSQQAKHFKPLMWASIRKNPKFHESNHNEV